MCALCTIKGGFRGLAGRPQGLNKMNEVKRSMGWGWGLPWRVEWGGEDWLIWAFP